MSLGFLNQTGPAPYLHARSEIDSSATAKPLSAPLR
jgi:hypothetical protein